MSPVRARACPAPCLDVAHGIPALRATSGCERLSFSRPSRRARARAGRLASFRAGAGSRRCRWATVTPRAAEGSAPGVLGLGLRVPSSTFSIKSADTPAALATWTWWRGRPASSRTMRRLRAIRASWGDEGRRGTAGDYTGALPGIVLRRPNGAEQRRSGPGGRPRVSGLQHPRRGVEETARPSDADRYGGNAVAVYRCGDLVECLPGCHTTELLRFCRAGEVLPFPQASGRTGRAPSW